MTLRRALVVVRQEPWVWLLIIVCAGAFMTPIYWTWQV